MTEIEMVWVCDVGIGYHTHKLIPLSKAVGWTRASKPFLAEKPSLVDKVLHRVKSYDFWNHTNPRDKP